jgi:hypothetical protein
MPVIFVDRRVIFFILSVLLEIPLEILEPLTDQTVEEKQPFTFTCKVNKPNVKAKWLKDGMELTPADGYEILVDGQTHTLKRKEAAAGDKGKFIAIISGKSTDAKLTVTGTASASCCRIWAVYVKTLC